MEHLDLEEVIFLDGTMIGEVVSIDNGTIIKMDWKMLRHMLIW